MKHGLIWMERCYFATCPYCGHEQQVGNDGDCGFDGAEYTCEKCEKTYLGKFSKYDD